VALQLEPTVVTHLSQVRQYLKIQLVLARIHLKPMAAATVAQVVALIVEVTVDQVAVVQRTVLAHHLLMGVLVIHPVPLLHKEMRRRMVAESDLVVVAAVLLTQEQHGVDGTGGDGGDGETSSISGVSTPYAGGGGGAGSTVSGTGGLEVVVTE
jgi:uncharacterized membrane protein YgcG